MGKQEQNRHTSEITNHKTNPSFKWGRMFHLLDYHHWYYVKKVLANKKPHAKSNAKEVHNHSSSDPVHYARISSVQIREPIDKPQLQEHGIHPCVSTESSSLPSSPTTTPSHRLSSSLSTKGSRATRIKRKIAREVSKRTGRHRRSSTCPVNSELGGTNPNHNHVEDCDDGVVTMENGTMLNHGVNASCGLCTKMKIECPLGDENLVDMKGELSLNHMNRILQENLDGSHLRKQIRRTVSLQQSIESLDVRELMSKNKSFFLRIVDDQGSSLEKNKSEDHVSKSTRKNPLKRFGTFPINHPSCKKDESSDVLLRKGVSQKSYSKASSHKYARLEKSSTLNDRNHAPRIRFKDLRHKIKHVIKESKIDRHIIAMDAVLHKVPYGQKVPEESTTKDNISPRVSSNNTCDSESIISPSPESGKYTKTYKRRSPSLDESLDKYCNLFETTSSSKDIKTDTHNKSRLRVMDDYLDKRERKKLGRMFSFPDLQYFLNNQCENNYSGELCSRTSLPNKRIMSFNERKVMNDVLIVDFDYRHRFNDGYESSSKEDNDGVDEKLNSSNIDMTSSRSSIEVLSCDKDRDSVTTSICEDDVHKLSETPFGDAESKLQEATKQLSEDQSYSESPTFSFTNIDEDEAKHSIEHYISPSLKHVEIDNNDIEEFNYVKEILHLSGYLGTELLGTWYSSDQPVDPSIFIEFESCSVHEPAQSMSLKEISYNNHLSLFDVINETLLAIYERSVSYWCAPLSTCSRTHPMPKGYRILDEVWSNIKWYTNCSKPELDPSLDCITTRDLAKDDRWMNLQFDAECVGLEVEELIFEDLLDELAS